MLHDLGEDNATLVSREELEAERTRDYDSERLVSDAPAGTKRYRPRKAPAAGRYTASYMSPFFHSAPLSRYEAKSDLQHIIEREALEFASIYFDEEDAMPAKSQRTESSHKTHRVCPAFNVHSTSRARRKIKAPSSKAQEDRDLRAALKASLEDMLAPPDCDNHISMWRSSAAHAFRQNQSLLRAH
jgi:hypothetical protein